jgi:acyl phosphate:glycerol-3-phosphate acyltransferase
VTEISLKIVLSYLLGSLIGSLIVGRLRGGVDIRALGSGNAGGTNALRTQGKAFACWVMLIDVGKGWLATRILAPMPLPAVPGAVGVLREWIPVACGAAAVLGHVYPLWFGFRGGKGVATFIGALAGLVPKLLLPIVLVWLAVVVTTGFVGLASMIAAVSLPLLVMLGEIEPVLPLLAFGVFTALLIILTHRANIARMRAGAEPRARKLWWLGRRDSSAKAGRS